MRIAAAVFGGVGAALCCLRGVFWAGGWLFVSVMMGRGINAVSLLQIGSEVATAISGMLGLVGAGLVVAGTRTGAGASLMLVGAVGVAATVAVYTLLLSILMAPIENAAGRRLGRTFILARATTSAGSLPPWRSSSARCWRSSPVVDQAASLAPLERPL